MKCLKCDHPKKLRKKLVDFDYSLQSGIPGCVLHKVDQYTCPKCKSVFHDLGNDEDVVDSITDILLANDLIPRAAIRFVRTQIFQMELFEFAKVIGVNPTVLRELEQKLRILSPELSLKIQEQIIKKRTPKIKISFDI